MQQRYYDPIAGRFLSVDPVVTDANTGKVEMIAVGTPITGRPPHRSEHAQFTHSAPTLGV